LRKLITIILYGVPNYLDSFFRARYLGGLDARKIEALGFYSDSHRGIHTYLLILKAMYTYILKLQTINYSLVTLTIVSR
jgi:hypothetical protein